MKTRSDIHNEMYEAFMSSGNLDDGIKRSVIKGTGTGKSYDGIAIVEAVVRHVMEKYKRSPRILLLSNSKRLRDVTWVEEFIKWDKAWLLPYCTRVCYQTAYLWIDTHWDLVVADEGDFSLTDEYILFYKYNEYTNLLLMTGYVADRKKRLLAKIAPVCYTYTTQQAQDDGVLNKTQFKFVRFYLSRDKTIQMNVKGKTWMASENDRYIYLEASCQNAAIELQVASRKYLVAQATPGTPKADLDRLEKQMKTRQRRFEMSTARRKEFLWSLQSSRIATKKVLKAIIDKDDSTKVLIFSKYTSQIDKIVKYTYHSKNAGGKKNPNINIQLLNESEIRWLGVCDAINRGENLTGVDHIIKETYHSSPTDFQQQHGRGVRLFPDQTMHMFIMIPYYHKKVVDEKTKKVTWVPTPTQAQKWADDMVEGFDMSTAKTFTLQ